jgi:RNA polymerase sigma factor (sigma-70 family)
MGRIRGLAKYQPSSHIIPDEGICAIHPGRGMPPGNLSIFVIRPANGRDAQKNARRLDEQILIEKLKQGDEAAFREIVETRQGMVYNTVLGLLQNAEDAEDVTQDVFIKVFESVRQFKGESAFSTWLYRIAVTTALEFLRKKKRKKRFAFMTSLFGESGSPLFELPDFVHPGVQLDNRENARILFTAISRLPENQRVAFTLHKIEGLSYQETADVMQTSVSAIESLLHRAKQNLRKMLENFHADEKNRNFS